MKKNITLLFILTGFLLSCSSLKKKGLIPSNNESFAYVDKVGTFVLKKEVGPSKNGDEYITKKKIIDNSSGTQKVLEQEVLFSEIGTLKNGQLIMRPKKAQYTVWFDGKAHVSEMSINSKKRVLEIKATGSTQDSNFSKEIKLPKAKVPFCFFSQLVECLKVTGYYAQAMNDPKSEASLFVIWDGYPFYNETLSLIKSEPFSSAKMQRDEGGKQGDIRFSLEVGGQVILYILDKKLNLQKMFWVAQGISIFPEGTENVEDSE